MTKILVDNKKKIIVSLVIVIAITILAIEMKDNSQAQEKAAEKKTVAVTVQRAGDSKSISNVVKYPATVVGDQEVKITATTSGVATAVSFDLGDIVGAGRTLVRIDNQNTSTGDSGFRSGAIQQLEKAVEIADESYDLAKDNDKELDTDASESAKDIAKLQLENARLALESAVSGQTVKAPIAGTVTSRTVSTGDSISAGQTVATISKTGKVKIQFFADKEELADIKLGNSIRVESEGKELSAKIANISPQADAATRRFLIEAAPEGNHGLIAGTIISIGVNVNKNSNGSGNLILPLSSVNLTQNESYIFILEGETAKKIPVEVVKVTGETAEVKVDIPSDALIVVDGNKLISEGEKVQIKF